MKRPKFKILDKVYSVTGNSDPGIVIDATFHLLSKIWEYQVTFSPFEGSKWYYGHELSDKKVSK